MANRFEKVRVQRLKRRARVRHKITGTEQRPRLSVFRSAKHVYAQVVNDTTGHTIASVNSFEKGSDKRADKEACAELGKKLASLCKEKKVESVVFDKGAFTYHGRIKAFADGAREGGLSF